MCLRYIYIYSDCAERFFFSKIRSNHHLLCVHTVDRRPVAWIIRFTDELKCEHPRSDVKREHPHSLATCRSSGSSISQRVWRRLTLKQESLRQQSIVIICVWIVFSPRKVRGLRFHPSSRIPRTIPRGGCLSVSRYNPATARWKEDESIFEGHLVIVDQTGPERTPRRRWCHWDSPLLVLLLIYVYT